MITPQELRIGNYLMYNSPDVDTPCIVRVRNVGPFIIHVNLAVRGLVEDLKVFSIAVDDFINDKLSPLVLTEDIIEKLNSTSGDPEDPKVLKFSKGPVGVIQQSYHINISFFKDSKIRKHLVVTLDPGNQYMSIREAKYNHSASYDDDIIVVRNGDVHGKFMVHQLQNIFYSFTDKDLSF